MSNKFNRRDFLQKGAAAGIGIALGSKILSAYSNEIVKLPPPKSFPLINPPMEKVRIGFIGVGLQGTAHFANFLKIKNAELVAVCDIVKSKAQNAQKMAVEAGRKKPDIYTKGDEDYKRMCIRDDIDLVYIVTPWKWHVPMCLEAMKTGKHAAVEVPAAYTVDDCWKLVETSEKTGKYCIMMENCNYDRFEMTMLNIVKKGLLGIPLHAECGYLHDLRWVKHDMTGEGVWRRDHSMKRNGDFYPTHGLGPIAQCLDINRGNQFDYLTSMGTKTMGLHLYAEERFGIDSSQANEKFTLSDVVTTLIKTKNGETIVLTHDTNNPRPYSRDIYFQGTKGVLRKYPESKIYIEGISPAHSWEDFKNYQDKYIHPVWKKLEKESEGAGHGGMDFIEDYRLVEALITGREPDTDVYDAAALSVVTELSERSIANNSQPQSFPDFTRGQWKNPRELQVMKF